jgi:ADP-ribose pyrophosphatase YjhB (NUDIX family)
LLGHFSLPGGVAEVGEAMAATVAGELMEEVRNRGRNHRL